MSDDHHDPQPVEVVKNYTRARRFPRVLSKTHDGRTIPGGPYTYVQVVGGAVSLFVLWKSMPLWAFSSPWISWGVVVITVIATVILLGRMPMSGRNPFSFVMGIFMATTQQAPDSVSGMRPKPAKVKAVYSHVVIQTPLSPTPPSSRRGARRATSGRSKRRETVAVSPSSHASPPAPADPEILEHQPARRPASQGPPRHTAAQSKSSVQSLLDMAQKGA